LPVFCAEGFAQDQPADQHLAGRVQQQQLEIEMLRTELKELKALLQQQIASQKSKEPSPAAGDYQAAAQAAVSPKSPSASAKDVAAATAATDKRLGDLERVLRRFRWSGDMRVRGESFIQDLTQTRSRARIRVRAGFQGSPNEDFAGGIFLAGGALNDPVSTNQTLTDFFTRKPIGIDRAWITYEPKKYPWLQLTGGKWAYTWLRTGLTFDQDLNPEGFSERFSFDTKNSVLKNVTVTGVELLYNEVTSGPDGFVAGGQTSATLQFGSRVKMTVAGTALNWQGANAIIRAVTSGALNGNRNSNATVGSLAAGTLAYASQFLYVDALMDTQFKTPWERWPARLTLDYVTNPRAVSDQNDGFLAEIIFGRQLEKNDLQFSYSFARIEQDAVISAFNESDMRAQTNVLQNKTNVLWLVRPNVTASFTGWFGRTLNRNLQNAAVPPGLPPGEQDPILSRLQLDLIYRF
jgi:hypothetical protein